MVLDFAKADEDREMIERYLSFKGKCIESKLFDLEEIARLFKISEELKR